MTLKTKKPKNKEAGRCPSNLLALDFAATGVKAVRLKKIKDRIVLAAADLLPAVDPDTGTRPDLPRSLFSYYTALCATMTDVSVRVFSRAVTENEALDKVIQENLGVPQEFRTGGKIILQGKPKKESLILGVAVPEKTVQGCLQMFSAGAPAPRSLEVSGLAALSAFLYTCRKKTADRTVCFIETGARCTYTAFLHRNELQMINRFDIGGEDLQRQLRSELGVDSEIADSILAGGTIDVSMPIRRVYSPLLKQISICREFVERQNRNTLSDVYLSGGLAGSPGLKAVLKDAIGVTPGEWNPFSNIEISPDVFPESLKGQENRFAAAVGAALSGMEAA